MKRVFIIFFCAILIMDFAFYFNDLQYVTKGEWER